jgi:hypothetical protein
MTRRTGHIPDSVGVEARRLGLHLHPDYAAIHATPLPLATHNRSSLPASEGGPGVQDQSDTGACEGFAHSSGATLFFAVKKTPIPLVSAQGLYYGALKVDRVPAADGSLPKLFDTGTTPSAIQLAWSVYGAASSTAWGQNPCSTATMYVDPNDPAQIKAGGPMLEPTPEQMFAEFPVRFGGAFFVQSTGLQKVLGILSAVAAGYPVTIAIPASGKEFQNYMGGVLGTLSGPVDHANLIADYAWTGTQAQFTAWQAGASGLDSYLIGYGVNSWGTEWGESDVSEIPGGMYRFSRSFFDQLQSPSVLNLRSS